MPKRKRRLTKEEVQEIQQWMASAPMGRKPTVRQVARRYGVNQPSVLKSLGEWNGIRRERPGKSREEEFGRILREGATSKIEGFTQDMDVNETQP